MNSYYQNILEEVLRLYTSGDYKEAQQAARKELEVPYVPADVQKQLEETISECSAHIEKPRASEADRLEAWIHGTPSQKEKAVSALLHMNLRDYLPEVRMLLNDSELLQEFKGELIEALMEQNIEEEICMDKDGMQMCFVPSLISKSENDPVLGAARQYFDEWLSGSNAMTYDFACQLLHQEALEMRPLDFEGIDPKELAASIVRLVYEAMKDNDGWKKFAADHALKENSQYPLFIEKRGEYS